jgi:hypothetical protein
VIGAQRRALCANTFSHYSLVTNRCARSAKCARRLCLRPRARFAASVRRVDIESQCLRRRRPASNLSESGRAAPRRRLPRLKHPSAEIAGPIESRATSHRTLRTPDAEPLTWARVCFPRSATPVGGPAPVGVGRPARNINVNVAALTVPMWGCFLSNRIAA